MPKHLSGTHWSADADATKALVDGYKETQKLLNDIAHD